VACWWLRFIGHGSCAVEGRWPCRRPYGSVWHRRGHQGAGWQVCWRCTCGVILNWGNAVHNGHCGQCVPPWSVGLRGTCLQYMRYVCTCLSSCCSLSPNMCQRLQVILSPANLRLLGGARGAGLGGHSALKGNHCLSNIVQKWSGGREGPLRRVQINWMPMTGMRFDIGQVEVDLQGASGNLMRCVAVQHRLVQAAFCRRDCLLGVLHRLPATKDRFVVTVGVVKVQTLRGITRGCQCEAMATVPCCNNAFAYQCVEKREPRLHNSPRNTAIGMLP